jgi:pimeloyl-ACP methyl ester carboxylesterase
VAARVEQEIEANGLRFETLVAGPENGEAVILLHGYPQSASSWQHTLDWLAGRGYRGVAPNLRGYSPGANPLDAGEYAMSKLVADVIGIAGALGVERFHLVGHDWGGGLAWMVAGMHPDRLLSLTVISTPHLAAMAEALRTPAQALRSSYMGLFRLPRVPEAMLQFRDFAQLGLGVRASGLPRKAWERDREQLRRVGIRGPLNWYRGATRGMDRPRPVTVPTMFIWGRRDAFLGRRAAEFTEKYVKGEYRFVEMDAGHWIMDRNTAEFHRLLGEQLDAHHAPVPDVAPQAPGVAPPAPTTPESDTEVQATGTSQRPKKEATPKRARKPRAVP